MTKQMIAAGGVKIGDKFRVQGFTHAEDQWLKVEKRDMDGTTIQLTLEDGRIITRKYNFTVHIER